MNESLYNNACREAFALRTLRYMSPCGELLLGASAEGLCLCDWTASRLHGQHLLRLQREFRESVCETSADLLTEAARQLDEYFAHHRQALELPLNPVGTPFQRLVWQALLAVPFGETVSYSALAERIGRPSAVRAVAGAVGANPLSLFVPCHRIVGRDGSLTGYAGGLTAKRFLLAWEQHKP